MEHLEQQWSTYGALGAAMEHRRSTTEHWSSNGALGAAMEHFGALVFALNLLCRTAVDVMLLLL
jgi:hypothetical protein